MNACPPDHKHAATQTCYTVHRCRCEACVVHRRAYLRDRKRFIKAGLWGDQWGDLERVSSHLTMLAESMSHRDISVASGVPVSTVSALLNGSKRRISADNADRILDTRPSEPRGQAPAWRARRRLEALAARGWPVAIVAAEAGMSPVTAYRVLNGSTEHVRRRQFDGLCAVYDRRWHQDPPTRSQSERTSVTQTKRNARARGYAPPAAWDDIDDACEQPKGMPA